MQQVAWPRRTATGTVQTIRPAAASRRHRCRGDHGPPPPGLPTRHSARPHGVVKRKPNPLRRTAQRVSTAPSSAHNDRSKAAEGPEASPSRPTMRIPASQPKAPNASSADWPPGATRSRRTRTTPPRRPAGLPLDLNISTSWPSLFPHAPERNLTHSTRLSNPPAHHLSRPTFRHGQE
jgi:hypothetical protein